MKAVDPTITNTQQGFKPIEFFKNAGKRFFAWAYASPPHAWDITTMIMLPLSILVPGLSPVCYLIYTAVIAVNMVYTYKRRGKLQNDLGLNDKPNKISVWWLATCQVLLLAATVLNLLLGFHVLSLGWSLPVTIMFYAFIYLTYNAQTNVGQQEEQLKTDLLRQSIPLQTVNSSVPTAAATKLSVPVSTAEMLKTLAKDLQSYTVAKGMDGSFTATPNGNHKTEFSLTGG